VIPRLNLNQPVNVAFTRSMLRNPSWNSSFDFILSSATNIVRAHCLKMSILAGLDRFLQAFYPNPWKDMSLNKLCGWRAERVFSGFGSKIVISSKA
jgi:hypothetical protein